MYLPRRQLLEALRWGPREPMLLCWSWSLLAFASCPRTRGLVDSQLQEGSRICDHGQLIPPVPTTPLILFLLKVSPKVWLPVYIPAVKSALALFKLNFL